MMDTNDGGDHLLYGAGTYGTWILRMSAGKGIGQPELFSDTGRDTMLVLGFANGGSTLVYSRTTDGFDIHVTDLQSESGGDPELQRVSHRALDWNGAPDWSPDGRRIAYVSSVFGGRRMPGSTRLVVRHLESGRVQEFPLDCQPYQASVRWWPDGQFLLVRRFDVPTRETVVERVEAETGTAVETIIKGNGISDIELAPDASALYFTRPLNLSIGQIRHLRVHPDGRRVVFMSGSERPRTWAMDNFLSRH